MTTRAPTRRGVILGLVIGALAGIPVFIIIYFHLPTTWRAAHPLLCLFVSSVPFVALAGPGSHFIHRRRFVFRPEAAAVEVATTWFFLPASTQRIPFSQVRSIELHNRGEGPATLEMVTKDGRRWTLRSGSLRRLRNFATDIAPMLGKTTGGGMLWS